MQIFCTVCSRWVSGGSIYIYIYTHSTEEHFSLALVDVQLLGFLQASICQLCRCWSGSNRRGHAELPVFGSCLVLSICSFFFVVLTCCFFASVFCGFSFWSVWREDVLRTRTAFRSCWWCSLWMSSRRVCTSRYNGLHASHMTESQWRTKSLQYMTSSIECH